MNWYKKAQQQLMFYPFNRPPDSSSQKVSPVSIDPVTKQPNYKCHNCGNIVNEDDVNWYKDPDSQGKSYQLPEYNKQRIASAFAEISQYLMPMLGQLQEYIQREDINTNDWANRRGLSSWEAQVPQLPNIMNNYNELRDVCVYKTSFSPDGICSLFDKSEINGETLNSLSDFIQNPSQFVDEFAGYSQKQFNISNDVPVCDECFEEFEKCSMCDQQMTPDMEKYPTTWGETACHDCVENGRVDVCHVCGEADTPEDMHYQEDMGYACKDCYESTNSERIEWATNTIASLDIPVGKNYPINAKRLSNLDNFITNYIKKYGDNLLKDEQERIIYLATKARMKEDDINYLNFMSSDNTLNVSDVLDSIENSIEAQDYMKEQYPQLSSYEDLPFDIDVVENYNKSKQGFTITITPSKEFFNYAKTKYPNVEKVWDDMSRTPHHSRVLAYARCAYEGGDSLVINNLQRDADSDNLHDTYSQTKLETAKWIDSSTKHWDVFLLNLVKAMAMSQNKSAFLTTFDQQKNKWGNLPIHKSKKTYQKVPEQMGFSLNDVNDEGLIEDANWRDSSMYQVANDMNWYKRAQLQQGLEGPWYHGTASDFKSFDINKSGTIQTSDWGKGIYLTRSKSGADHYRIEAVKHLNEAYNAAYDKYANIARNLPPVSSVNSTPAYTDESDQAMAEFQAIASELNKDTDTGTVMEIYIDPNAKIAKHKSAPGMTDPFLAQSASDRGYDAVLVDEGKWIEEMLVMNPDIIKTKQLVSAEE